MILLPGHYSFETARMIDYISKCTCTRIYRTHSTLDTQISTYPLQSGLELKMFQLSSILGVYIVFSFDYDKGYIRAIKSGGYLFVTLEHFYHHFNQYGNIAYFDYTISPHGYHTSDVTSLFERNLISKATLLNEDYFPQVVCI